MKQKIMAKKLLLLFIGLLLSSIYFSSCKSQKGCGCGNNLNYYKPKKFNK